MLVKQYLRQFNICFVHCAKRISQNQSYTPNVQVFGFFVGANLRVRPKTANIGTDT